MKKADRCGRLNTFNYIKLLSELSNKLYISTLHFIIDAEMNNLQAGVAPPSVDLFTYESGAVQPRIRMFRSAITFAEDCGISAAYVVANVAIGRAITEVGKELPITEGAAQASFRKLYRQYGVSPSGLLSELARRRKVNVAQPSRLMLEKVLDDKGLRAVWLLTSGNIDALYDFANELPKGIGVYSQEIARGLGLPAQRKRQAMITLGTVGLLSDILRIPLQELKSRSKEFLSLPSYAAKVYDDLPASMILPEKADSAEGRRPDGTYTLLYPSSSHKDHLSHYLRNNRHPAINMDLESDDLLAAGEVPAPMSYKRIVEAATAKSKVPWVGYVERGAGEYIPACGFLGAVVMRVSGCRLPYLELKVAMLDLVGAMPRAISEIVLRDRAAVVRMLHRIHNTLGNRRPGGLRQGGSLYAGIESGTLEVLRSFDPGYAQLDEDEQALGRVFARLASKRQAEDELGIGEKKCNMLVRSMAHKLHVPAHPNILGTAAVLGELVDGLPTPEQSYRSMPPAGWPLLRLIIEHEVCQTG